MAAEGRGPHGLPLPPVQTPLHLALPAQGILERGLRDQMYFITGDIPLEMFAGEAAPFPWAPQR